MLGMKARLTKGALWLAAAGLLVNLAAFANTLLLARLLVPSDFGLVAIGTTVATIIMSVTELSLSAALVHHRDPQDDHFHSAFTLNFARAILIALVILVLSIPISQIYGDRRLVAILVVIGATTVLSGLVNPKMVVFSRGLIFKQDCIMGVSQKVIGFIAASTVAIIYKSYWALVAGNIAMQISALVLSYLIIPYRPRVRFNRVRDLLSYSIWLSLGQAVNTLNWKSDQLAIGYFLGSSPLGFYTVGDTLSILPTREATTPLAQTLFPGFARLTGDPFRLRQAYQRAQSFLFAVALPIGCGFAIIAQPMILLTMGERWLPAVPIIQLLASIFAVQTLASSLQPLAMALGDTRGLFNRDVCNLMIRLPSIFIGLIFGGLIGIVYARCFSGIASTIVNMLMVRRLIGLSIGDQIAVNTRSIVSVIIMAGGTYLIGQVTGDGKAAAFLLFKVVTMAVGGACIYAVVRYVLWRSVGRPAGPERDVADAVSKARLLARI